jgi:hypothetical protein
VLLGHAGWLIQIRRPLLGFQMCALNQCVVQHLRFALHVRQVHGRAKLPIQVFHEGMRITALALVPVVVGPGVAHRPAILGAIQRSKLSSVEREGTPSSTAIPWSKVSK